MSAERRRRSAESVRGMPETATPACEVFKLHGRAYVGTAPPVRFGPEAPGHVGTTTPAPVTRGRRPGFSARSEPTDYVLRATRPRIAAGLALTVAALPLASPSRVPRSTPRGQLECSTRRLADSEDAIARLALTGLD